VPAPGADWTRRSLRGREAGGQQRGTCRQQTGRVPAAPGSQLGCQLGCSPKCSLRLGDRPVRDPQFNVGATLRTATHHQEVGLPIALPLEGGHRVDEIDMLLIAGRTVVVERRGAGDLVEASAVTVYRGRFDAVRARCHDGAKRDLEYVRPNKPTHVSGYRLRLGTWLRRVPRPATGSIHIRAAEGSLCLLDREKPNQRLDDILGHRGERLFGRHTFHDECNDRLPIFSNIAR